MRKLFGKGFGWWLVELTIPAVYLAVVVNRANELGWL